MQDTSGEFREYYRKRIESLPDNVRLLRALRMFDHGKTVMRAGLKYDHPDLSDAEIEQRLFLRMYGDELSPAMIERALARIAERFQNGNGPGSRPISTRPTAS